MKYVLDANVVIAGLNGVEPVRSHLASVAGSEVGVPIVAIAELYFGAYKSQKRAENIVKDPRAHTRSDRASCHGVDRRSLWIDSRCVGDPRPVENGFRSDHRVHGSQRTGDSGHQ